MLLDESLAYWKVNLLWSTFNVFNLLSVWHVTLLTVDRYLAIYHPAKFFRLQDSLTINRRWALPTALAAMWVAAAVFAYVPSMFIFVWGDQIADEVTGK